MTTEERFERIERILETVAERMERFADAHIELEAAQINQQKAQTRFVEDTRARFDDVGEKIANLTILVDRLIERDLGR